MEKVVYLLGAGFSAPLGIPVMSNFLTKSRDLYRSDPSRFAHFKEVFDTISELSVIKNFYGADLFNIEEILSILEMREYLEGSTLKDSFLQYIRDVITHYTPSCLPCAPNKLPGNWWEWVFSNPEDRSSRIWEGYGRFVGSLCNLEFTQRQPRSGGLSYAEIDCVQTVNAETQYSIVTLNYDCVPESIVSFINHNYSKSRGDITLRIAKLHGSIDSAVIVPPTWAKGVNKTIVPAWKQAYEELTQANHLRVIGYSLPTADAYVKYLLKSAVIKAEHLKTIDVLCLDDKNGGVQKRYDEFMAFSYRFINRSSLDYLEAVIKNAERGEQHHITLSRLETTHEEFMKAA
jgi:hypothetical protein